MRKSGAGVAGGGVFLCILGGISRSVDFRNIGCSRDLGEFYFLGVL